jgi:hypothetical protein
VASLYLGFLEPGVNLSSFKRRKTLTKEPLALGDGLKRLRSGVWVESCRSAGRATSAAAHIGACTVQTPRLALYAMASHQPAAKAEGRVLASVCVAANFEPAPWHAHFFSFCSELSLVEGRTVRWHRCAPPHAYIEGCTREMSKKNHPARDRRISTPRSPAPGDTHASSRPRRSYDRVPAHHARAR